MRKKVSVVSVILFMILAVHAYVPVSLHGSWFESVLGSTEVKASSTKSKQVSVDSITLKKSPTTLISGKTYSLTYTISPANATNKKVVWSSSDEKVVTVANGKLTAKDAGTATVTVTTSDGGKAATCDVTVIVPVSKLNISDKSLVMSAFETVTLTVGILPENAKSKNLQWSSSNDKVVTVTDGVLTAVDKGTATITVKTEDGRKSAYCTVKVNMPVSTLTLNRESDSLVVGQTRTLSVIISPENADNKKVIWESSDESVAKVVNGIVTAKAPGTAVITVQTLDGTKLDTCDITVTNPSVSITNMELKRISKSSLIEGQLSITGNGIAELALANKNGDKIFKYGATINNPIIKFPGIENQLASNMITVDILNFILGAYNTSNKNMVWKSSNENVLKVVDGKLTTIGKGTTQLELTNSDGSKSIACSITITGKK